MSYIRDWCGEPIRGRGCATLDARGLHDDYGLVVGGVEAPHYHAGAFRDDDSCLLQALRLLDAHHATSRPVMPREQLARDNTARKEADKAWRALPRKRQETLLFQVLGDERFLIRELVDRINGALGFPQRKNQRCPRAVYEGDLWPIVMRLLRDGQLERQPETFNKTHTRYRYFCRRTLEGPIAELDRAYRNGQKEAA